jgi:hypothetical protein
MLQWKIAEIFNLFSSTTKLPQIISISLVLRTDVQTVVTCKAAQRHFIQVEEIAQGVQWPVLNSMLRDIRKLDSMVSILVILLQSIPYQRRVVISQCLIEWSYLMAKNLLVHISSSL